MAATGVFPDMAQRRKTYPAPGGSAGASAVPLAPLPALGTSEPTSPFASAAVPGTGAVQRPTTQYVAGQATPGPLRIRTSTGIGGVQPGAWKQLGTREQAAAAMQTDSEALRLLDPYFATNMQLQSEQAALAQKQQMHLEAIGAVTPTAALQEAATPPDLKGLLGDPGLSESYWNNLRTATLGEIRARFNDEREYYEGQARRGAMPRAYAQRMMAEVDERQRGEELKAIAGLDRQRSELTEAAKQQHANLYLQLSGQAGAQTTQRDIAQAGLMERYPTEGVQWTDIEGNLRDYQNSQLAALMGLGARGGGGGGAAGGGGAPQPWQDTSGFGDFGFGTSRTPHFEQYTTPVTTVRRQAPPPGVPTPINPAPNAPNVTGFSPVPAGGYEFLGDYGTEWF